jgi:hypothetical protein
MEKYIKCYDKFNQQLFEGDYVDVQKDGVHQIYKKEDGQLYFKPYGEEDMVCAYFSNDIAKCDIDGNWINNDRYEDIEEEDDYSKILKATMVPKECFGTKEDKPLDNLEERFKRDMSFIITTKEQYSYLQGFIDQFGDGELGELDPNEWDVLQFLEWLKLNNYEIIKKK